MKISKIKQLEVENKSLRELLISVRNSADNNPFESTLRVIVEKIDRTLNPNHTTVKGE